uniref:Uncharacterized protein n=1 Tax=Anguilla anguilla TaxID=7936 RepID=A0A0E9TGT9_ANGAN
MKSKAQWQTESLSRYGCWDPGAE